MSCYYYCVEDEKGGQRCLHFAEGDDEYRCLCTFPGNDAALGLNAERVRSLAVLGAAVVLAVKDELEYGALPYAVPEFILQGIDEALGIERQEKSDE